MDTGSSSNMSDDIITTSSLHSSILFLSQVHAYASSVKIEVIYPALEGKVKNVTLGYVSEHHDEGQLFDQLLHILSSLQVSPLSQQKSPSQQKSEAFGTLVCKVEEVHLMLKTHLKKEEDLLLPLLLQHFSDCEQAELVAQLLYSIPLIEVDKVLSWLRPSVSDTEQANLMGHIKLVVPDSLLLQLLTSWLSPTLALSTQASSELGADANNLAFLPGSSQPLHQPPIRNITHIHRGIGRAIKEFTLEARSLQKLPESAIGGSKELSSLSEHFRFIRFICLFHSSSEDHVIYPAFSSKRSTAHESHSNAIDQGHKDDEDEIMEQMSRLLTEVRTLSRRGKKEVVGLVEDLCQTSELFHQRMTSHMAQEEREIFPLLEQSLSPKEQRVLLWRTIKSMPLRLLERVLPWIVSDLSDGDRSSFLDDISLGAPSFDSALVQLLNQWAAATKPLVHFSLPHPLPTCCDGHQDIVTSPGLGPPAHAPAAASAPDREEGYASAEEDREPVREAKRQKVMMEQTEVSASLANNASKELLNPIDHIFQFHQALRLELKGLEEDASRLEKAIMDGCPCAMSQSKSQPVFCPAAIQKMDGRFQFLWGIYRAHSRSEDEIIFPALESKDALRNVSHAYSLDHEQEEQLFVDLEAVIVQLRSSKTTAEARPLALDVRKMCAAIRASLETHVKSEEAELWPLFSEHFTTEEQQYLVGVIIGRTGAQVLQTLLPWVSATISQEEKEAMVTSLRLATKNTMFDQWLGAVGQHQSKESAAAPPAASLPHQPELNGVDPSAQDQDQGGPLSDVVEYLSSASPAMASDVVSASALARVNSSTFRPGWEEIFRMNQSQLEAAIHRVSNDSSLDASRKAYLIQNIITSRYIVAQQKRMRRSHALESASSPADDVSLNGSHFSILDAGPSTSVRLSSNIPSPTELDAIRSYHRPPGPPGPSGGPEGGPLSLGCKHYRRKCQLVAPCCGKPFVCRLCHDEQNASHRIDRYKVAEVLCMQCGSKEPVGKSCGSCKADFAAYYCEICHLYDDDPSHSTYHCPFCNLCRRGKGLGIDYCHCMSCNSCMPMAVFKDHVCRSRALESDCPICSESLFDSPHPVKELDPCGHLMHSHCFASYCRYNYTCPICSKSIGDMTMYFKMLETILASERLPPECAGRTQLVHCSDCGKSGFAPWHYVYHKCPHCSSFNTKT